MDKGGSLAVNLNNLYILCTARLLQANLKMNVESLDSVVHILSGLRGAYAQIIETPEARRAGGGNCRAHAARGLGHENRPAHHTGAGDGRAARPCPCRLRQKRHAARHSGGRARRSSGSGGAGHVRNFAPPPRRSPLSPPPARSLRQARQQLSFPLRPFLPAPVFAQSKPGHGFFYLLQKTVISITVNEVGLCCIWGHILHRGRKRSFTPMFCNQCEQTAKGTGCTVAGVCGKSADVAVIQDQLIYLLAASGGPGPAGPRPRALRIRRRTTSWSRPCSAP